jgi:NAD-dependent SIR2 family protein deacetylase
VAHLLFKDKNVIPCLNCGGDNSQAVIIAPTLYKSYGITRLQNVWDCAEGAISCSDRLVIIGYSLAPADTSIIATIKRALNIDDRDREIIVINPNRRACERYSQFFGGKCTITRGAFTGQVI